ncbi:MAG TPA: hypothetical protein VKV04_09100 [Verrucomicrobiae bacterium]|nr:hypothetical protein [Verrucomicrobiae bacterium]
MNEATIESLLFRAPSPAAPPELLQRLQAAITLQPAKSEMRIPRTGQRPFRRWFPTLAFGLVLVSCAVMFGVQLNWSAKLKQQNESLRVVAAGLPQLREQHAAWEKAVAQQQELEGLRRDNQELHQLQTEVARLTSLSAEVTRLREQNRRLAAAPVASNPSTGPSFFDQAQQQAERIQCVNNLKQLGLAMRIWEGDNHDKYPTSLAAMSNECSTVKILICPSDKSRQSNLSVSWADFNNDMSSYQYLAQPDDGDIAHPDRIMAICPIHHNYLLEDGSVQSIDPAKYHEVQKDGRLYLEPINSDSIQVPTPPTQGAQNQTIFMKSNGVMFLTPTNPDPNQ